MSASRENIVNDRAVFGVCRTRVIVRTEENRTYGRLVVADTAVLGGLGAKGTFECGRKHLSGAVVDDDRVSVRGDL